MEMAQIGEQPDSRLQHVQDSDQVAAERTEKEPSALRKLQNLAVNKKVEQMRQQCRNAVYVAGRLALAGQISVELVELVEPVCTGIPLPGIANPIF